MTEIFLLGVQWWAITANTKDWAYLENLYFAYTSTEPANNCSDLSFEPPGMQKSKSLIRNQLPICGFFYFFFVLFGLNFIADTRASWFTIKEMLSKGAIPHTTGLIGFPPTPPICRHHFLPLINNSDYSSGVLFNKNRHFSNPKKHETKSNMKTKHEIIFYTDKQALISYQPGLKQKQPTGNCR